MSREILLLVDALAREKNVNKDVVFVALEMALASATKKRFSDDAGISNRSAAGRSLPTTPSRIRRSRSRCRRRSSSTPTFNWKTISKSRWSRSNSAASAHRPQNRSSCRRFATPSASRSCRISSAAARSW